MKKICASLLCLSLLFTGCEALPEQEARETHDGGSHTGIAQGRGFKSIYRDQANDDNIDLGTARPFFRSNQQLGQFGHNMTRTNKPGTRIGRDQLPIGYAYHYSTDPAVQYQGFGSNFYVDKTLLAEAVSQIVVGLQNIDEATVIITDEECLIGYEGTPLDTEEALAEQVEKSGLSVTPRWYKVYVSNDPAILANMHLLSTQPEGHSFAPLELEEYAKAIVQQMRLPEENRDTRALEHEEEREKHKIHKMGVQ
jgi:hypothetical protein